MCRWFNETHTKEFVSNEWSAHMDSGHDATHSAHTLLAAAYIYYVNAKTTDRKWSELRKYRERKICQRNTVHVIFFTVAAVVILLLLLYRIHFTDANEYCWTSILTVNWIQFTQVIASANGKIYWRVSFKSRWIFEKTKKK